MINRQEAARAIAGKLTDEILVTGLGNAFFDMYRAGDRALNFYSYGAMGTAVSLAFGLARTRPQDRVVCLEGDGSLLMNLGTLATVGRYAPANLACVIWDNSAYLITGGQPTPTQGTTDLAGVARACGIPSATLVTTLDDLTSAFTRALREPGPQVVVAKVDRTRPTGHTPRSPMLVKHRFMGRLGTLPDFAALAWS